MRLKAKITRFTGAALAAGALLLGSTVAAPSATAISNVWADLHWNTNCTSGGYYAFSSGAYAAGQINTRPSAGLRYNQVKGGNNHAHGAYMDTLGAVLVQPHATVKVTVLSGKQYTYDNKTDVPQCKYQFDANARPRQIFNVSWAIVYLN